MANEIALRVQVAVAKAGWAAALDTLALSLAMAGTKGFENQQTVGITEEALLLGDVGAANTLLVGRNLDATNFITIKPATGGVALTEVRAGQPVVIRFTSTIAAPFVQADTAPCEFQYVLIPA
jgi:hypothetical protein